MNWHPSRPLAIPYVILLIALITTASSALNATAALSAEPPPIEVGLARDGVFGLGGQYIIDKGIDRKHGFIMKPRWADVVEIIRLLGIGAITVGLATSEPAVRANLQGIPLRLVQPYMTSHHHVLVRHQSPYKTIDDLKGKPLALTGEVTSLTTCLTS